MISSYEVVILFTYNKKERKNNGPKIDPRGTPNLTICTENQMIGMKQIAFYF